jgi:hypothetical protein
MTDRSATTPHPQLVRAAHRLEILIAVVVLIAAAALVVGRRRLNEAYRLELDTKSWGSGALAINPSSSSRPASSSRLR